VSEVVRRIAQGLEGVPPGLSKNDEHSVICQVQGDGRAEAARRLEQKRVGGAEHCDRKPSERRRIDRKECSTTQYGTPSTPLAIQRTEE
jgi:hypothetical protein